MQHLHAYWRMEYIEAPKYPEGNNPFTALPKLDDATAFIVHRSQYCYLVLNRFPYNAGHLLAVPFRAVTDLPDLTAAERVDLMELTILGEKMLRAALNPDGFNIGYNLGAAAGSSIPHLHAHIVPRWAGDTNFMPVIGRTRVLPTSLEVMYQRLRAATAGLAAKTEDPR
ncbi:MAG: HIT domain-containing protein [Opitutaceae bacterium]|nr:HIT domain-containing protein [Opitutaceae bacterium]